MPSIVYIDPQSYNNLSLYDHGMLTTMKPDEVTLFGSAQWDCNTPNADLHKWFTYNSKKNPVAKGLSYVSTILRIASYIRRHREVKIVHIQWLRLWTVDILFARWLRKRGIKVVFTAHNLLPHDSGDKYRKKYRVYYNTVDRICVHTEATKNEIVAQFGVSPDNVTVIPHGIIESEIPDDVILPRAEELRAKYSIDSDTLVISSLGIQSFYKGIDMLINLWSQEKALNSNPRIRLLIIGKNSGLDYSPIKNMKNVTIVDERVSNEDFQAFLEVSDVVLLPYRRISQSGMLFSAVARNKPVVVSNVGGLPEPLKIGNIGWNIGEATESNLADVLLDIVNNPDKVRNLQTDTQKFRKVRDFYSWNSIAPRLRNLYMSLLNE